MRDGLIEKDYQNEDIQKVDRRLAVETAEEKA
jgi:hypothetical protein